MENIALWTQANRWLAFFTGLSSVSGVLLGTTREQALIEMAAPPEVSEYLRYNGDIGELYGIVESYISGEDSRLKQHLAKYQNLQDRLYIAYLNAELWVADILSTVENTAL